MPFLIVIAALLGIVLPLQSGVNAQLRNEVGSPLLAALVSFTVGMVALLALNLAVRTPLPSGATVRALPWWYWIGGLLGATSVFSAILLAPRLGAATLVAAIICGQMVTSLILDHFGWAGYTVQPITLARLLGASLIIGGVILIQRR